MALPGLPGINTNPLWGQAQQQAQDIYAPILDQINRAYERERQEAIARQQAQAAATDQAYAAATPGMEQLWSQAIQEGTNLENAVANRLKGVGETNSKDYQQRLAQINAPQGAGINLQGIYSGASGAGFARGMNDVSRLIGRKAESLSWLQKQPGLARQQSQGELNQALEGLFKGYDERRGEALSGLGDKVQGLYDQLYGRAADERNAKNENAWKQVQFYSQQVRDAAERQAAAAALGDKKAARAAAAAQKAADRELARWKAELQSDTTMRGQDITARGQDIRASTAAAGQAAAKGKSKNETVNTPGSAKRGRVVNAINKELFVKGQKRQWVTAAYNWNIVASRINGVLRDQGVDPNSPLGIQLRKNAFTRLGVATGPGGNPTVGPKGRSGSDRPRG